MVIFNATFSSDKPVFFPNNWHTGKTEQQLYLEWQQTYQYAIYSNILQTITAAGWLSLILVILIAAKHIHRLWHLPQDCNEKKYNRKYLKGKFLGPVIGLSAMWVAVTCYLVVDSEWTRLALAKGLVLQFAMAGGYWVYMKVKPIVQNWRRKRRVPEQYQSIRSTYKNCMVPS